MGSTKVKTVEYSEEAKATEKMPEVSSGEKARRKEAKKPVSKKIRSRRYLQALGKVDRKNQYPLVEAVEIAKSVSYSKFPAALEAHINTQAKNIRGLMTLPYASGRKLKVLVFGPAESLKIAEEDKNYIRIGSDEDLKEVAKGKINFDVLVATTQWMPKIVPMAKVLGPKGLMPNPKNGTVTDNLPKTIAELQGGKIEYKTENNRNVMHLVVGKITQPSEQLSANIKSLFMTIGKSRIKKITISPTMGPGVKVNLASI